MKLRNRKTGEIADLEHKGLIKSDGDGHIVIWVKHQFDYKCYNSLAELNEEWEDYEEPKERWVIDYNGEIIPFYRHKETAIDKMTKSIGNYFETEEEAEKAVEKLRAVKRLKDKGFKLDAVVADTFFCLDIFMRDEPYKAIKDDLKIVFGDEE